MSGDVRCVTAWSGHPGAGFKNCTLRVLTLPTRPDTKDQSSDRSCMPSSARVPATVTELKPDPSAPQNLLGHCPKSHDVLAFTTDSTVMYSNRLQL